jgi:tRNA dimethylallyltransferase
VTSEQAPLLVVVGPTASGKSALAALLAEELSGEVVSADSVQVYRHFDIGAGKPTPLELERAPHHLIDIADPLSPIEAHVWAELAEKMVEEIRARGRVPIVCGGTFLWVRALLFGLAEAPPGDPTVRAEHKDYVERNGRESLHQRLLAVDPRSAARLHPNDFVRVSRALEVYELTGEPFSEIQERHGFREARYRAQLLMLDWEREAYEARLALRVRQMMEAGFRQEVIALLERGYGEARAMAAVGYRQVKEAVETPGTLISDEELLEQVVRVTRVFARRQRTWLRDEALRRVPVSVLERPEELRILARELRTWLSEAVT